MSDVMQLVNKKIDLEFSTYCEVPDDFMPDLKPYSRAARHALKKMLKEPEAHSINVVNHLHLKSDPNILVSLSHTKDMTMAAIGSSKDFKSIGVDIENSKRIVKPGIEKFFINAHDEILANQKDSYYLKIWCAKEAIFKAVSPLYQKEDNKVLVLKDIILNKDKTFNCFHFKGHYDLVLKDINQKTYLIAIAAL
ncbi:MAG: hypothetical protein CME69_07765 [Halobacteriovorax sp.]|nr:hypothetical protein [Halobacteriovorax sp.]|tara:strand:- start:1303 stop:1884 length:582 start_codon:yes stop_codon:yes gene_type:complete